MTCGRITYRRRHAYNTSSNKIRGVRTPSGRLVAQYLGKSHRANAGVPTCPITKRKLQGVCSNRKKVRNSWRRKVSRPYGGHLNYEAVKEKIIRAFLIEAEGGLYAWKVQTVDQHRGPSGVTDYNTLKGRLPNPPKGKVWHRDLETREWSIVQAPINNEHETDCQEPLNSKDTEPDTKYLEHVVLPTDTFQGLCLRYKVKPLVLRQLNKFSGNELMSAPKKLLIPCGKVNVQKSEFQEASSESYKIRSFCARIKGLRNDNMSSKEARIYLASCEWNISDAVKKALAEIDWERDQETKM